MCSELLLQFHQTFCEYVSNISSGFTRQCRCIYYIRFTSDTNPSDIGIPNDGHPCTGTGFTGSENHLIPEYKYPATTPTDGAIYKIDADGNETMVGMWDKDANRFYPVL